MADRYVDLAGSSSGTGLTSTSPLVGASGLYTALAAINPGETVWLVDTSNNGLYEPSSQIYLSSVHGGTSTGDKTIAPFGSNTNDIVISGGDNNTLMRLSSGLPGWDGILRIECSYITVKGITIKNSGGSAIRVNATKTTGRTDVTIQDVTLYNNWGYGIQAHKTTNLTLDGVKASYTWCRSKLIWPETGDQTSVVSIVMCPSPEVKNCIIWDSLGEGIIADGLIEGTPSSSVSIHDNVLYNNRNIHIYYHGINSGTNVCYNNVCYCTEQSWIYRIGKGPWRHDGIWLANVEPNHGWEPYSCKNIDVYNNLIVQCSNAINLVSWYLNSTKATGAHQNLEIQQNTIVDCGRGLACGWGTDNYLVSPSGNIFRNNVVKSCTAYTSSYWRSTDFATADYNCWHGGAGLDADLSGANDVTSDPDLVGYGASLFAGNIDVANYIPDTGSPILDAGADSGITVDFFGTARAGSDTMGFAEETAAVTDDIIPDFTEDDNTIAVGGTVTFSDNSTESGSASIDARYWEFEGGNPTTSTAASPEVTYSIAGSYDVKYTVYDADYPHLATGKTIVKENRIIVSAEGGDNSLVYDVVQFANGTTTVSHSLGVVPQAALFVGGSATAVDSAVAGIKFGFGVADTSPITTYASCVTQNDGTASADGWKRSGSYAVQLFDNTESTTTQYCAATLTAVSSSDITLSWTGTDNNELFYVILFGGSAISEAVAFNETLATSGSYADVSGNYNAVVLFSTLSSGAWNVTTNFGAAVRGGNQVCGAFSEGHGSTSGNPKAVVRNDAIAYEPRTGGKVTAAFYDTYTRFSLSGSNLEYGKIHGIALNTGDIGVTADIMSIPTTTGNNDETLTFDPGLLIGALMNVTSENSVSDTDTAGAFAIYATDGTTKFTYGFVEEDAAATINNATHASAEWRQLADDQSEISDNDNSATGVTLGTNKFTVSLDPAGGGLFPYIAFEDGGTAAGLTALFTIEYPGQAQRDNPIVDETITFRDLSDGDGTYAITAWDWDWDDGTASGSTQNPTHSFDVQGVYKVTLTVTDADSAEASYSMIIIVDPHPEDITWSISYDTTSGEAPLDVEVDWSATTIAGQTIDTTSEVVIWKYVTKSTPGGYYNDDGIYITFDAVEAYYQTYTGTGTTPTIEVIEPGVYSVGFKVITVEGNTYYLNYPYENDGISQTEDVVDVITVYEDVQMEILTDLDWRIPYVGPQEIQFTLSVYPPQGGTIDWDFGDGDTLSAEPIDETQTHEFAAVSSKTYRTVEADVTFASGLNQQVYVVIKMVPAITDTRTEAEITALLPLVKQVSGCIETTDWSKTGGQTNVYEATLTRPWAAATARVIEDGALLTGQVSIAAVDAAAGSYYCSMSGDDLTIYVHTTNSDNPATNGSNYRFIRPA